MESIRSGPSIFLIPLSFSTWRCMLSVATGYFLNNGGNQEILSCASATVAFIGIMLFHTYKLVNSTQLWQYFAVSFPQKEDAPAPQRSNLSITSSAISLFDRYCIPLLTDH